jgi:phytoene dehydrogenase-like protein
VRAGSLYYIEDHDGTILLEAPVKKFITEGNVAKGVELEDGRTFMANKAVVTCIDPKHTFLEMIDEGVLDEKFLESPSVQTRQDRGLQGPLCPEPSAQIQGWRGGQ